MTDRDLLTNAAKAYFDDSPKHIGEGILDWVRDCKGEWNPLTDDGDALRLAVKLALDIRFQVEGGINAGNHPANDWHEPGGDDPYAATRRAIVRAAAEIGKAMA